MNAANLFMGAHREYNVNGGNILGYGFDLGSPLVYVVSNSAIQTKAFDPTITNYLYISVILGNTGDSVTVHGYTLKNF
jgi:hypothetical protein